MGEIPASGRALGDGCSQLGAGALSHLSGSLCGGFLPDHKSRCRLGTVGFRVVWNFTPEANVQAAARKAAETLAKMPGAKVIKHAQAHRHVTASSSVLHGWDEKGNPIPFTLNMLNINSIQIDQDSPETR